LRAQIGVWSVLLGLASACSGTERAIFEPLPPRDPVTVSLPNGRPRTPNPSSDEDAGIVLIPAIRYLDDDAGSGPDPGLDPTAVFTWTQSLPGQGTCKAGHYVGKFTCTVADSGYDPAPLISGSIQFTLSGSPEEPILHITAGQVSGSFFGSGIGGMLVCSKQAFTGMTLLGRALLGVGATGTAGASGAAGQGANGSLFGGFNAMLDGHFDSQALVIAGSFTMTNDAMQMCNGDFRVSAAP
jgi:hypothetical protein